MIYNIKYEIMQWWCDNMSDNGYSKWQDYAKSQKSKRRRMILIAIVIIVLVSALLFCFGYDNKMTNQEKMVECGVACIGLIILLLIVAFNVYKIKKYVPVCNKCGKEIRDVKKDCVVGKIDFVGTIDKTVYENASTTVKGQTVYNRGVYAMKNDTLEHTSTTTYDISQKVPVVKKFYVYNIEYRCKNCNELFYNYKEESVEPLHTEK